MLSVKTAVGGLVVIWAFFLFVNFSFGQDLALAKKIAQLHKKTLEKLNNYYAETEIVVVDGFENASPEQANYKSGQFWSTKTTKRFRFENPDGTWFDGMITDGKMHGLRSSINKNKNLKIFDRNVEIGEMYLSGIIQKSQNIISQGSDIDRRLLLTIDDIKPDNSSDPGSLNKTTSFEKIFDENYRVFKNASFIADGKILIEFDVKNKYNHVFIFDPNLNYLMIKYTIKPILPSKETPIGKIIEVSDFAEFSPGVFFPRKSTESFMAEGKLLKKETVLLNNVVINSQQIENQSILKFPMGIKIIDTINGKIYKSLNNGNLSEVGDYKKSTKSDVAVLSVQSRPSSEEHDNFFWGYTILSMIGFSSLFVAYKFIFRRAST